jgi:hypothetical protein
MANPPTLGACAEYGAHEEEREDGLEDHRSRELDVRTNAGNTQAGRLRRGDRKQPLHTEHGDDGREQLGHHVEDCLAEVDAPCHPHGKGHGRIEVPPGNGHRGRDHDGERQPVGDGDPEEADCPGPRDVHHDRARADEDESEGSQELGRKWPECGTHTSSSPSEVETRDAGLPS